MGRFGIKKMNEHDLQMKSKTNDDQNDIWHKMVDGIQILLNLVKLVQDPHICAGSLVYHLIYTPLTMTQSLV